MDRKIKTHLFDIHSCIEEIEGFFGGNEVTLYTLLSDMKTIRAVERVLEIIGEATKKTLKLDPHIAISNSREIIDARNFIAHEYGSITYELIVKIINNDLPILKEEVKILLEK